MKYILLFISLNLFSQTIKTDNNLIINHGDITLYLTKDTCSMVSKHVLTYENFLKLDKERDNKWFQDKYKGKYRKEYYQHSGYDLGHFTPSHITSYDNQLNHYSFSLFNQAPQLSGFNRGKWAQLEKDIEEIIKINEKDVTIITGVIYNPYKSYLNNSRVPIPIMFFKVLFIGQYKLCWIGSNINGEVKDVKLSELNEIFKLNKQKLKINP